MRKINTGDIPEESWTSPKGKYSSAGRGISAALGRDPQSTDLRKRHPFDVELCRIPPGKTHCPYHSHSAQWEFYHVLSGHGQIRHAEGITAVGPGDAFLFAPEEPHGLSNDHATEDFVYLCVADNPIGESCFYPDSGKWLVRSPERRLIRSGNLDYFDGEE